MKLCEIRNLNNATKKNAIIQGKVVAKSNLLLTKHETQYFWCIIQDKFENKEINENNETNTEPSEIKIMFWDPFGKTLFSKIQKNKIYDFQKLKLNKHNKKYHKHSYQLTWTKDSLIKEKQNLNMIKHGFLCIKNMKKTESGTQICIKHFFK